MRSTSAFIVSLIAIVTVTACESSKEDTENLCHPKAVEFEASGHIQCAVAKAVIEGGFDCPAALPFRREYAELIVCSEVAFPDGYELPETVCADLELQCGVAGDGGDDDSDSGFDCAEAWSNVKTEVTPVLRPTAPAMHIDLSYEIVDGRATITLNDFVPEEIVGSSDGPFEPGANSGSWVEIQNGKGDATYTRAVFQLIAENVEAPLADGGFVNGAICPSTGVISLTNFPTTYPSGVDLVFFSEPIDGVVSGTASNEIARFELPPPPQP